MQYNYTDVGSSSVDNLIGWLKFWIDNIQNCKDDITWDLSESSYFFNEDSRE